MYFSIYRIIEFIVFYALSLGMVVEKMVSVSGSETYKKLGHILGPAKYKTPTQENSGFYKILNEIIIEFIKLF